MLQSIGDLSTCMESLQSVKHMTLDQVQLELIQVKNELRDLEDSAEDQIGSIKIETIQKARQIKMRAELEIAILKKQGEKATKKVRSQLRDKAKESLARKKMLYQRKKEISSNNFVDRLRMHSTEAFYDRYHLLSAMREADRHEISKASIKATEGNYDASQYSFRSAKSQSRHAHSYSPNRKY